MPRVVQINSGFSPGLGVFMLFLISVFSPEIIWSQDSKTPAALPRKPPVPIPMEFMAGHEELFFQLATKRSFGAESKFHMFALATYSAAYNTEIENNRSVIVNQISYDLGKGFGVMTGLDYNSTTGIVPVAGPQHSYANKEFLAVSFMAMSMKSSLDFLWFGLYEYKPALNDRWNLYTRGQFFYNRSLADNANNISTVYLWAGLKRKALSFGAGSNWDWLGDDRKLIQNYGLFVRWEFL